MRYYDLSLYKPDDKDTKTPIYTWTSHPKGKFDPCALGISFDAMVCSMDTPAGGTPIRLTGIHQEDLKQSTRFGQHIDSNGKLQPGLLAVLKGGMEQGLPLANPAQKGVLLRGQILQSFGNWEGTDMTLDFVVYGASFTTNNPGDIVLNWKAGTPLSQALQDCLKVAYPDTPVTIQISSKLVMSSDDPSHHYTLESLSQHVRELTQGKFLGDNYPGVSIVMQPGLINVFDGTNVDQQTPKQINFTDLIGQPTWIGLGTMQMKLVMRGDLNVGGLVTMPKGLSSAPGQVETTAASYSGNVNADMLFQGKFQIVKIRHIGESRSPDGAAWCTVVDCVSTNVTAGQSQQQTTQPAQQGQGNG